MIRSQRTTEQQFKRIHVKIIIQGKTQKHEFIAPAGKMYSLENIDKNRESVINWLDERFPHFDFREVQIGTNAFNYIATGVRPGSEHLVQPAEQ